jgi:hypothetical protein
MAASIGGKDSTAGAIESLLGDLAKQAAISGVTKVVGMI